MEYEYQGQNKVRKSINAIAKNALILYAVLGSCYNATKTGHQSADIATGRVQPTALERTLTDFVQNK